jgi:hypothetical protein
VYDAGSDPTRLLMGPYLTWMKKKNEKNEKTRRCHGHEPHGPRLCLTLTFWPMVLKAQVSKERAATAQQKDATVRSVARISVNDGAAREEGTTVRWTSPTHVNRIK